MHYTESRENHYSGNSQKSSSEKESSSEESGARKEGGGEGSSQEGAGQKSSTEESYHQEVVGIVATIARRVPAAHRKTYALHYSSRDPAQR